MQLVLTAHEVPDDQLQGAWIYLDSELWAEAGSLYFYQIQGATVQDVSGKTRGTVVDFLDAGGSGVLVVQLPDGQEIYLPNHTDFVNFERVGEGILVALSIEDFL
ncbi:MAG: PRC-barrel domain-containing protein [Spirochaetia bacterium]|nr:PRC-barrel domain-containing protein [Spirochaetia bacterium]